MPAKSAAPESQQDDELLAEVVVRWVEPWSYPIRPQLGGYLHWSQTDRKFLRRELTKNADMSADTVAEMRGD